MNEDPRINDQKAPEVQDETKHEELNVDQLDQIAGGGSAGNTSKRTA
jgi:hypothetical protein